MHFISIFKDEQLNYISLYGFVFEFLQRNEF